MKIEYNCKLYSIYANPEHVHFLVFRSPRLEEEYEKYLKFYQQTIRKNAENKWGNEVCCYSVATEVVLFVKLG